MGIEYGNVKNRIPWGGNPDTEVGHIVIRHVISYLFKKNSQQDGNLSTGAALKMLCCNIHWKILPIHFLLYLA